MKPKIGSVGFICAPIGSILSTFLAGSFHIHSSFSIDFNMKLTKNCLFHRTARAKTNDDDREYSACYRLVYNATSKQRLANFRGSYFIGTWFRFDGVAMCTIRCWNLVRFKIALIQVEILCIFSMFEWQMTKIKVAYIYTRIARPFISFYSLLSVVTFIVCC